tara:strand:+ start:425 stop:649 length:225 start_codon:yes stop_codon:yes gene_type:complete
MKKLLQKFWSWVLGLTTVDEKIMAAAKETKRRAKLVKEEVKDVAKAVKEVGGQIDDIAGAIKGEARKGRKKQMK